MSGLLAPTLRETMLGNAQILEVFNISKVGKVAGCRVTDGTVERGANVRLIRDNVVVHEGKLSTLKRFKDEVKEVAVRPGMRHGVRELRRHACRRRHRVLSRGDDPALLCKSKSYEELVWTNCLAKRVDAHRADAGHPVVTEINFSTRMTWIAARSRAMTR